METELESEWQRNTVELFTTVYGLNEQKNNDEIGCIDFITEEDDETILLRVSVDEDNRSAPCYTSVISQTIDDVEENDLSKVYVLADRFTVSANRLIRKNEEITSVLPDTKILNSLSQMVSAIDKKTISLCEKVCGKAPEFKDDCKGIINGNYVCSVRRISDDSTFHAKMVWMDLLINDFNQLLELESALEEDKKTPSDIKKDMKN